MLRRLHHCCAQPMSSTTTTTVVMLTATSSAMLTNTTTNNVNVSCMLQLRRSSSAVAAASAAAMTTAPSFPLPAVALPPLRPITALYGRHVYRLEGLVNMKACTLLSNERDAVSDTDGKACAEEEEVTSTGNGSEEAGGDAEEGTNGKGSVKGRRRHVNQYLTPEMVAAREVDLKKMRERTGRKSTSSSSSSSQSGAEGGKGKPFLSVKPVLRYPMLQVPKNIAPTLQSPPGSSSPALIGAGRVDASIRKQQYFNVKGPEMVILEVTELLPKASPAAAVNASSSSAASEEQSAPASVSPATTTHHVAVFNDGTLVGFGLNDTLLRKIRSEVLDAYAEPKDVMLTADKEVIRLAARTNLCVFPAMDGDEAEMMTMYSSSSNGNNNSTSGAAVGGVPSSSASSSSASSSSAAVNPQQGGQRQRAASAASSIFPTSAAAIDRLANHSVGTDISLRYRFTTSDDLEKVSSTLERRICADESSVSSSKASSYVADGALEAVVLSDNTAMAILPFAFCFYELIQLRAFNALVFPIHEKVSQWQLHVAAKGTLPMSLKEARVLKAKLMRISSRHAKMTTRRHRLLWEEHHTAARQVFVEAAEHFELFARSDGFRRRTDGVQSSLAYLCDQAHEQKDIILEWVIIILISVEVYVAVKAHAHDHD